ncbi:collagen alpha-2(I) chain-like [Mus musculus]|uniref:collagen alpha-2(I) chain-like n=1 Tax=Mus musculus TaxID=10090 RepID=UPI00167A999D|nr:collagen alpha-2(I) chain-like [Mus musculus]
MASPRGAGPGGGGGAAPGGRDSPRGALGVAGARRTSVRAGTRAAASRARARPSLRPGPGGERGIRAAGAAARPEPRSWPGHARARARRLGVRRCWATSVTSQDGMASARESPGAGDAPGRRNYPIPSSALSHRHRSSSPVRFSNPAEALPRNLIS